MSHENLTKLHNWLMAGAPHVAFNMDYGLLNVDSLSHSSRRTIREVELNKPGVGDCGTVCCIAGAAYQMATDSLGKVPRAAAELLTWGEIQNKAAEWLGLTLDDEHTFHPLFDPNLAPDDCTPQQAAEAVQNVMEGKDPWPEQL